MSLSIIIALLILGTFPTQIFESSYFKIASEQLQADVNVAEISKQVTVRILTHPGAGSGVIIAHEGYKYTVLTNEHVVADSWNGVYSVLTFDGEKHSAQRLSFRRFGDLDLALVQFSSSNSYQVVKIGNSNHLVTGEPLYASGFPNWYWINLNAESTREWGIKAYQFTKGITKIFLTQPLERGYQLGYTNEITNGMSGGPVLDKNGCLVAINGRLKYPFQGIDAYKFTNGTQPSEELFRQIESLSWAIPSSRFQNLKLLLE